VVVAGGRVVGTGWHRRAGTEHAEVLALREAGDAARGATLYVTLEPCSVQGRTPPCVEAVLAAGVARVVAAMEDPDPLVAGRGIRALRAAGVEVAVGLGEQEAAELNEAYVTHRREARPFVTYKAALSLDGRTAAANRTSRWITGPGARRDVQRLRAASDAICVGIGTILADDPSLTVRDVAVRRRPLRVVVDSLGRTPTAAKVLDGAAPTMVVVTEAAPDEDVERLRGAGAEVVVVEGETGRVSVAAMLRCLATRGIVSLLMEGGATLAGSFEAAGLIDRYLFYLAPKLLGGGTAPGVIEGWAAATIGDARPLVLRSARRIGEDLRLEARPAKPGTGAT
jgi:diaminohydroxyphosphoribosylaminopyrimidine deaminase/5-amino-6-(5-phosphoribosylamino)uracil reductase